MLCLSCRSSGRPQQIGSECLSFAALLPEVARTIDLIQREALVKIEDQPELSYIGNLQESVLATPAELPKRKAVSCACTKSR